MATMAIDTIYLDMDGVLTDFEGRWHTLFGETPEKSRHNKEFNPNWDKFILEENFAKLPPFPGWDLLMREVTSLGVNLEILSSSGGKKYHSQVESQKRKWLADHGINIPVNIVPGRRLKANYATPNRLLIDDTPDVVMSFYESGGFAIRHESAELTIKTLKGYFYDDRVY